MVTFKVGYDLVARMAVFVFGSFRVKFISIKPFGGYLRQASISLNVM